MDISELIDTEVFQETGYWFLTGGALIAILIGFKATTLWGTGAIPLWTEIVILLLIPIAAYFITKYHTSR